ncbi:hypothetical protein PIB30_091695 [Stylosanthes scabra]|uniref:Uncharacterized protein n=1 Tax=Stylosanthes scabra TaxID=79078 RepID=A0ABU6QV69_9FABA|nr:hypothetical protein [Stylosanthes scabra]
MQKAQSQYFDELKALRTRQGKMVNQQNNFYRQIKREQEKTIKEIEEVKKFQEKEQKEAWKARKRRKQSYSAKQSYSVKSRELTPRRHYPRLGVAEPHGSSGLIQHPMPRRDARRLGMDEATQKRSLHQVLNA